MRPAAEAAARYRSVLAAIEEARGHARGPGRRGARAGRGAELEELEARARDARGGDPRPAGAAGSQRREERHPRDSRRHRRRRGGALRHGPVPHVLALRGEARLEGRAALAPRPVAGGAQGGHRLVSGDRVFSRLKYERGVHRVQRVPATESQGRIHTSTVTVAVLPEAEEVDVKIDPKDLRIDVFRASGPGGQSVNTTDSAVRITHDSDGDHGAVPGREVAAQEQGARDEDPALAGCSSASSSGRPTSARASAARRWGRASAARRSAPTTSRSRGSPITGPA